MIRTRIIRQIILAVSLLVALPLLAHAASTLTPIIPTTGACTCSGSAPDWGCVLATVQIVMNDLVAFATIIITIYIAWAGVGFLLSPTNSEGRTKARARITNAVLGLLIALAAWLFIDSLLKVIYNSSASAGSVSLGPWNSLLNDTTSGDSCIKKQSTPALPGLAGGSASQNANGGAAVTTTGSTPSGACGSTSGLNCSSAVSYLTSHANPLNDYTGKCAQYVRLAIAAGGLSSFSSGQGNAYQYGSILTAAKFTAVYSGTYSSSSGTAFSYQEGDVIVFQPVSGHPYGHIAMYTGSQWVSDALQSNMASNQADYQGGSFTVYRP